MSPYDPKVSLDTCKGRRVIVCVKRKVKGSEEKGSGSKLKGKMRRIRKGIMKWITGNMKKMESYEERRKKCG